MTLRAVAFDLGETLVDETRMWSEWADWLGVPRLTFLGVLGWLAGEGLPHTQVFERFRPDGGFDLEAEREARRAAGRPDTATPEDLYPDARPCLAELRRRGYRVAIAGNQPVGTAEVVRSFDLPVDLVTNSGELGAEKPSPEFYERLAAALQVRPAEMAYVGDRVDNDVEPALAADMVAVFIRRGPWGFLQAERCPANAIRIDSLSELPAALEPRR
jgi:FMN phosphatase YigB (HAD superfamily)